MGSVEPFLRVWTPAATPQELEKLNLPDGQNALKVKYVNRDSPEGRAVLKAGLKINDYIIAIAGKPFDKTMSARKFSTHVKLNYKSGQKLPITLLRNGKRIPFEWLLQ